MVRVFNNDKVIKLSDFARQKFIDKGLDYSDIQESDFFKLVEILREELKNAFVNEDNICPMCISKDSKAPSFYTNRPDNSLNQGFIYVDSDYFKGREAISFNTDGWIGFAGWADEKHVKPFVNAFMKWVDKLINSEV